VTFTVPATVATVATAAVSGTAGQGSSSTAGTAATVAVSYTITNVVPGLPQLFTTPESRLDINGHIYGVTGWHLKPTPPHDPSMPTLVYGDAEGEKFLGRIEPKNDTATSADAQSRRFGAFLGSREIGGTIE